MSIVAPIEPPTGAAAADSTRVLYERHSARLFAFCLRRLGSPDDADDALQQTFLNAFAAMRGGFVPTSEKAWLYRIAENVCTDRLRAVTTRRKHESTPEALETAVAPSSTGELRAVAAALGTLNEQHRRALVLRAQGLSYREIGRELSLSQAAVETLLFRARRSLARRLDAFSFAGWLKPALTAGGAAKATAAAVATIAVGVFAIDEARERPSPTPPPATSDAVAEPPRGTHAEARARPTQDRRPADREAVLPALPGREQPLTETPVTTSGSPERPRSESAQSPAARPSASTEPEPAAAVAPPVEAPQLPPLEAPDVPVPVPVPDPTTVVEPIVETVPELPLPLDPELPTLP